VRCFDILSAQEQPADGAGDEDGHHAIGRRRPDQGAGGGQRRDRRAGVAGGERARHAPDRGRDDGDGDDQEPMHGAGVADGAVSQQEGRGGQRAGGREGEAEPRRQPTAQPGAPHAHCDADLAAGRPW